MVILSHNLNPGMFHMIYKRALLVEVSCTLISLMFYFFKIILQVLGASNGLCSACKDFSWKPCS